MNKVSRHSFGAYAIALLISSIAAFYFYQNPVFSGCQNDYYSSQLANCIGSYSYSKWFYASLVIVALSVLSLGMSFKKHRKEIIGSIKNGRVRRNFKLLILLFTLQVSVGYLMWALTIAVRPDCSFDRTFINYQCDDLVTNVFWIPGFLYFVLPPVLAKLLADWRKWNLGWLKIIGTHILAILLTVGVIAFYLRFIYQPHYIDPMYYGCPNSPMIDIMCGVNDTFR